MKDVFPIASEESPPGSSFPSIVRRVSLKWRKLPEDEKHKYREAYAAEREARAAIKLVGVCCFLTT